MMMGIYLAVDTHEKKLVVDQLFNNWPDAFIAAVSRGKAKWKRYKDGFMRPVMRNGRLWNEAACAPESDEFTAKFRAAENLRQGLKESHLARYRAIGFRSFDGDDTLYISSEDGEEKIKEALLYGRLAGCSICLDGRLLKEGEALS